MYTSDILIIILASFLIGYPLSQAILNYIERKRNKKVDLQKLLDYCKARHCSNCKLWDWKELHCTLFDETEYDTRRE